MDFLAISGCDTSLYHSQGGATVLSLCALRHDCNKCCILSQIPANLTQTATDFRCTISLYCERNNLLSSTFLMHSICWNGLHSYRVICEILFDGAATSGIGLQRPALTKADW